MICGVAVMNHRSAWVAALALAAALASTAAFAQVRLVFVNGQRMTHKQIHLLEQFHCAQIPNGAYWLNLSTGAWGYVGNWNVQGYFGDPCSLPANAGARQQRQSLSERGMLYSPNEIMHGVP
jgi:hypothetical protein